MYIYMVEIESCSEEKKKEMSKHGAFKTYRGASEWLISQEFKAFYDDELSEFVEEESIGFMLLDKITGEKIIAHIFEYYLNP